MNLKSEYFKNNRVNVFEKLEDKSLAIFFAGDLKNKVGDQYFKFTPDRNFYYLTGIEQEKSIFVLYKNGTMAKELIFTEKISPEMEKWIGKKLSDEEINEISGIPNIFSLQDFESVISSYISNIGRYY